MLPSGGNDGWSRNLAAYDRTCRQSTNQNTDENIVPGYPPIPQQAHVIHPSFATPSHMNSACTPSHHVQCHANYPASAWRQNNSIHSQHVRPITNQHSTHCAAQFQWTWRGRRQHHRIFMQLLPSHAIQRRGSRVQGCRITKHHQSRRILHMLVQ